MDKYKDLNAEQIAALATEKRAAFDALIALDSPTVAQVEEAEALANEIEEIHGEITRRETEASEAAEKFASLKQRFAREDKPEGMDHENEEGGGSEVERIESPGEGVPPGEVAPDSREEKKAEARGRVATLATKTKRPAAPEASRHKAISITAAADVPSFSTGQSLEGLEQVAKAVINRAKGFSQPTGDGRSVNLQQFGTAMFALDFDEDLIVDRHDDAMEVLARAADETRLPGGSLVAAGGWCAPSETVYDLSNDATTEGMLSIPEIGVKRGGIRFATSPVFSDFYANPGFIQTEAQAIAGTTKPCVEVPCPAFTEVRLDAEGICIKVPILTNAAYPEVVSNFISGTLIAHQHWINANVIGRLVTAAGTARTPVGLGSTAADTLGALELLADQKRQTYRLSMKQALEVVVPFWVKGAIRADLQNRTATDRAPVTDAEIQAHFAARNLNVQFVYDWQNLPTADVGGTAGVDESVTYPGTYQALMYPAGTFVKGTADVINLNTVYDAASLATNVYTGLFVEQGLLVAKTKNYQADLITLPVDSSGRTGKADLASVAATWA